MICKANQMTGFYMKCNNGLEWLKLCYIIHIFQLEEYSFWVPQIILGAAAQWNGESSKNWRVATSNLHNKLSVTLRPGGMMIIGQVRLVPSSVVQSWPWHTKKTFHGPFLLIGFNCFRATDPLRGDSLLLTTKFPEILGTHLINLSRRKG